jgi:hypothetical protein
LNPAENKWETIIFYGERNPERCIAGYDAEEIPTPEPEQAVATQAANAEVGEKAGELAISRPEGNSRA